MPQARYLQIADHFRRVIATGGLTPGERLSSVRDAAQQHAVSLSTVLQAYRLLEDEQLVVSRPKSGFFVASPRRPAGRAREERRASAEVRQQSESAQQAALQAERHALGAHIVALAELPEVVSFGAAYPSDSFFDQERLRRCVARAAIRHRDLLARYNTTAAHPQLQRAVARYASSLGCVLPPEQIAVTNGCMEAIGLAIRATTQPGDLIAVESPTHFGFLDLLHHLGRRPLEIPTHPSHGLSVDALAMALQTQPVRAVLCIPTLSNPLGAVMPQADRRRLVALCSEHQIPVIEDVIYADLVDDDSARRAAKAYDTDGTVIICGSFTKTLAPGVRLGWVEGGRWSRQIAAHKLATSGSQTPVLQVALADLLNQADHAHGQRRLREQIAQRVEEAVRLIRGAFPGGTRVHRARGAYTLWLELPAAAPTGRQLFEACMAENICIAPGEIFTLGTRLDRCIRLSVGGDWDREGSRHRSALQRIGELASAG